MLQRCLPAVLEAVQQYQKLCGAETEVIVVDDAGSDDTAGWLARAAPRVQLVRRRRNGGFARACNSGIHHCRQPLLALINNDVEVAPDYFLWQARLFRDPDLFAVTARVVEWEQPVFATGGKVGTFRRGFWGVYFNYDLKDPQRPDARPWLSFYAVGGFAMYDRERLLQLGGFSELLSPFHWEDVDLSYRA